MRYVALLKVRCATITGPDHCLIASQSLDANVSSSTAHPAKRVFPRQSMLAYSQTRPLGSVVKQTPDERSLFTVNLSACVVSIHPTRQVLHAVWRIEGASDGASNGASHLLFESRGSSPSLSIVAHYRFTNCFRATGPQRDTKGTKSIRMINNKDAGIAMTDYDDGHSGRSVVGDVVSAGHAHANM